MTKVTHLTLDERGGLNRRRLHLREISGDADTPLETVGQDLRAARLRRGDDLATVSRTLKIRKDHLEAIEEDNLEALPGRTYAVGFVRSYADYLGLDPVQCVERFKREIAGRGEPPAPIGIVDTGDDRQLPHGWIVIALVVLVIVVYGAYKLARSADTLLRQPVAAVPAQLAPPPLVAAHHPAVKPAAVHAKPVVTAAQTIKPLKAVAAPLRPPPAAASPTVPAAPDTQLAALPPGQIFGLQNKGARVILHVKAPTRVLVQSADGTVFINRILHPGDSYRVPDRVGLALTAEDGSAVAVELDGQVMGAAAGAGTATRGLSLDPQAIVDRYSGGGNPG